MVTRQPERHIIREIVEKLVADYRPQKVILFGSYARGRQQQHSDIDLLIIKETRQRFIDRWTAVRRILSDANRTIPLETLVLTPEEVSVRLARGDHFLAEIIEKGKLLYAAQ
jgi:predicted nucleotidyltransferase